jgi:hypothetical protein
MLFGSLWLFLKNFFKKLSIVLSEAASRLRIVLYTNRFEYSFQGLGFVKLVRFLISDFAARHPAIRRMSPGIALPEAGSRAYGGPLCIHSATGSANCRSRNRAHRCVFHGKVATHSTRKWPPIPRQTGHPFHVKAATHSTAKWPSIPRQSGHRFQARPDSHEIA